MAAASKRLQWIQEARPDQITPPGDWGTWLILAGRGWGKTRTGAEDVAWYGMMNREVRIALLGPSFSDCRDTMIEGVSGLLSCLPEAAIQSYNRSLGELILKNGSRYKTFSAEAPEKGRGPQHHRAWVDELCAFSYPEAFDQLMFGLRLGKNPQCIITTTPKPTQKIKELVNRSIKNVNDVFITRGRTFDNAANLSAVALAALQEKYGGTRLGRQELEAEILEDAPGALWTRGILDQFRVAVAPPLKRIVVAIDPAVSTGEGSDETGIVAVGRGYDEHIYVLADRSGKFSPDEWARQAIALYELFQADTIIAEANQGGDMVENTLRVVNRNIPVKLVHAARGKAVRAEPVAALYVQGKAHHVGAHPILEDQMCMFTTDYDRAKNKYSPDRMDALVWGATELAVLGFPGSNLLDYYAMKDREQAEDQPPPENITRYS